MYRSPAHAVRSRYHLVRWVRKLTSVYAATILPAAIRCRSAGRWSSAAGSTPRRLVGSSGERRRDPRAGTDPQPDGRAALAVPARRRRRRSLVARSRTTISWDNWKLIVASVIVSVYAIVTCIRPVPYRDDAKVRIRIIGEQALHLIVVLATGAWASPFALCLIPSGMLAGFAAGGFFSAELAVAAIAAITAKHVNECRASRPASATGCCGRDCSASVAFTSGLTHRAGLEAARQQQLALDRVSRLAEANSLLFSLQRVAQTLPASLDLDDVLDSTVQRMQAMVRHDALSVFLVNATDRAVEPIRALGFTPPPSFQLDRLPEGLRAAMDSPRTVRIDDLSFRGGVSASARSGLYAALRRVARSSV